MDKENGVFTPPDGSRNVNDKSPFGLPEDDTECYRKLIMVLLKMLQPDFKTSDDTVLEKMLDFMRALGNWSFFLCMMYIIVQCGNTGEHGIALCEEGAPVLP